MDMAQSGIIPLEHIGELDDERILCLFSDHIKERYIRSRDILSEVVGIPQQSKCFVNPLLLKCLACCGEKEINDIAFATREGLKPHSIAQLSSSDTCFITTNSILDILKSPPNHEMPHMSDVFLINGAPGMGKTTLCNEIAYRWAKNQLLDDVKFVLFVCPQNHGIVSLNDFVHYFYDFDEAAAKFADRCAHVLAKRNDRDIIIMLDGYNANQGFVNDSFLGQVVSRKELAQCRLIVTALPNMASKLLTLATNRIEILGFTDECMNEYIAKEFQSSHCKIEALSSYLKANKTIGSICYIPMIMGVLVQLYNETDELPQEPLKLVQNILCHIISRYVQKDEILPTAITSLQDFPRVYKDHLMDLSKIAFEYLKNDKVVFTDADIKSVIPNFGLPTYVCSIQGLGFLKSTESVQIENEETIVYYNFVHSYIQTFLAAHYVYCQDASAQFQLLRNTFFHEGYTDVWIVFENLSRSVMSNLFHYSLYCNACPGLESVLQKIIAQNLDVPQSFSELTKTCITNTCCNSFQIFAFRTIENKFYNTQCLRNTTEELALMNKLTLFNSSWNKIYLSLCQTDGCQMLEFFVLDKNMQENVYSTIVLTLCQDRRLSVMILNTSSMLGYRAVTQQMRSAFDMNSCITNIILRDCLVNDEIARVMSSYIETSKLRQVIFMGCTFSNGTCKMVFDSLSHVTSLEMLSIGDMSVSIDVALSIASTIMRNNKLFMLEFLTCDLKHETALNIITALKSVSTIKTLAFSDNDISEDIADDLAVAILVNHNLQRLRLSNNKLLQSGGAIVASAVSQICTLVELNLNYNNLSEKVADELAMAIKCNKLLEILYLSNNKLKTSGMVKVAQSLSSISNLKRLNIQSNGINEGAADALANAILSNSKLEELYLGFNNLATGILKIARALQSLSTLKVLDVNNNNATGKVASELAAAIYNNRLELQQVWLAYNQFKSGASVIVEALRKSSILLEINLTGNWIPEDVAESIAAIIDRNHFLEDVRLSCNRLMTGGIIRIAQSLSRLSTLKLLNMADNKIDDGAADAIAAVILSNKKLKELSLNDNLFQTGATTIAKALRTSSLTSLYFNSNRLPDSVAEELASAVSRNSTLNSVSIMNNCFKSSGMIAIAEAIRNLTHITFLNVFNNHFADEAAESLSLAILHSKGLQELYIGDNYLCKGTVSILKALEVATKLKKLNMRDNSLSEQLAEDLAVALSNKPLELLDMENNSLKARGVTLFAKSLSNVSTLKMISFQNNHITEGAADGIASLILSNSGLTELYLAKNKLRVGALKIASALKHISSLKILDLSDNDIPSVVADELASAIVSNSCLEQLRLRGNLLKSSGIQVIARSLTNISTLKTLNFRNNGITEAVVDDIVSVLSSNKEIEHLYLGNNMLQSGIVKIAVTLKDCTSLKTMDFDNNNVPRGISEEIAAVICKTSLESLYLMYNLHFCVRPIVQSISQVSTLTYIDLNDNYMTGTVANQLATAVSANNSLETFRLRNNCFSTLEMLAILRSLCNLTSLKCLNLGGNNLDARVADVLSSVLMSNSSLQELYLGNNILQEGVVKVVAALNQSPFLSTLDLSNNSMPEKAIEELSAFIHSSKLEQLYLEYNNLHVSADIIITALSKISTLKSLYLNDCNLTDVVASRLSDCVANNHSLQELQLKNNHFKVNGIMTILESLSKVSKLKLFNIRNNHVSKEAAGTLATVVLKNITLEQVYLGDNKMGKAVISLVSALKHSATIAFLNLANMGMTEDVADELAATIGTSPLLEELYLPGNKLLSTSLTKVINACKNIRLKLLDIRSNSVDPAQLANTLLGINRVCSLEALYLGGLTLSIEESLCSNLLHSPLFNGVVEDLHDSVFVELLSSAVQKLNFCNSTKHNYNANYVLSFNYMDHSFYDWALVQFENMHTFAINQKSLKGKLSQLNFSNVVISLPIIKQLTALDLEQCNIDEQAAFELAAALSCNVALKHLWLKNNRLNAAGALFILNSLEHISTLKVLDLSYNNIGYQLANSMAAVIDKNCELEQLWLDGNSLLSKGVVQLAHSLKCLTTLRVLSLCDNGITDEAADELSSVLANNTHLEDVLLSSNQFQSEGVCRIAQSLTKLFRLRKLDLFNNRINKCAAGSLADVICNSCALQELCLSNNMLETIGTIEVLKALQSNCKLQVLTLSNNNISGEVVNDLVDVLVSNKMFCVLLIGGNYLQSIAAVKIAEAVKNYNTAMRLLALCDNMISEQAKDEIKAVLLTSTHLQLVV